VSRHGIAFGTRVSVTTAGLDPGHTRQALEAAMAEIHAVEAAASLYLPQSALVALNRRGSIDFPATRLQALFAAAARWSAITDGAFDVSVQPLWDLYAGQARHGSLPSRDAVAQVLEAVDFRGIHAGAGRIAFARPGMRATLNGIVQGYAADRALAVLKEHGARNALVDAGEFAGSGGHGTRGDWQLGVRDPLADRRLLGVIGVADAAVATSGDYGFAFSADRRHHHIFDPRLGRSPAELAGVTVVAPDATAADALSTACMVMGVDAALACLSRLAGVHAVLVRKNGSLVTTPGLQWRPAAR
jgi:thiamine biosynthesis lipoprotein